MKLSDVRTFRPRSEGGVRKECIEEHQDLAFGS